MHALLKRNDSGQVVIRWSLFVACLGVYVLIFLVVTVICHYFTGARFRAQAFAITTTISGLPLLLGLYVAKRHAEGKSARQFSLSALMASTAVVCILLALVVSDRRAELEYQAKRQQFKETVMAIVGTGTVHVSTTTFVQVGRPSFNDDDLEKIVRLKIQLDDINSPLYFLDLSGTNVTDHGVAKLATMDSLEYLFLERTAVTDVSIDSVEALPKIRVMSVMSTAITPERLLNLSVKRPQWNINPKTYQRLKTRSIGAG